MHRFISLVALSTAYAMTRSAFAVAVIASSGNQSGPSTVTTYDGNQNNGFSVVEAVSYNGAAGPWHKELRNIGNPIASGNDVPIDEQLTNAGPSAWTDWHEEILSTTSAGPNQTPYPGFLFTAGSVHVARNGGILNEGTDYTLVPTTFDNGKTPGGDWVALSIFFSPSAAIQPGDTLQITKDIFEVFGDGNIWATDEIALLAQYPTVPEPSGLVLAALGLVGLVAWLRRKPTTQFC